MFPLLSTNFEKSNFFLNRWFLNFFGLPTSKQSNKTSRPFRAVILKVGEIAPLGAISKDKGAKKTKGAIGGRKIMKGAKTLIDR